MERKCKNCEFYDAREATLAQYGHCHRFPPIPIKCTEKIPETEWPYYQGRVEVDEDSWCGEFKEKKQ